MEMILEKLSENSPYLCRHISDVDKSLIDGFKVKYYENADSLETYIKEYALEEESIGFMRTYLVIDKVTFELVGYFSLKAGMFTKEKDPEEKVYGFDTIPGVELSFFAINMLYELNHKESEKYGLTIFRDFIIPLARYALQIIGVGVLYVFSLPNAKLIEHYENNYKFNRLDITDETALYQRMKPNDSESCIFMYQRLR